MADKLIFEYQADSTCKTRMFVKAFATLRPNTIKFISLAWQSKWGEIMKIVSYRSLHLRK